MMHLVHPGADFPSLTTQLDCLGQGAQGINLTGAIAIRTAERWVLLPPRGTQYFLRSGTLGLPVTLPSWEVPPVPGAAGSTGQVQYNSGGSFAATDFARYDAGTGQLQIEPGPGSGQYVPVGGSISQETYNFGTRPIFNVNGGEETLLTDYFNAVTLSTEGASILGQYMGLWKSKDGLSTQRIRVYISDGSNVYMIYDTGAQLVNGAGVSGDMNGIIDGGATGNAFWIDVFGINWDSGNSYGGFAVRFTNEDVTILAPPNQMFTTPPLDFNGGFGNPNIIITGESSNGNANEMSVWMGKTNHQPYAASYY